MSRIAGLVASAFLLANSVSSSAQLPPCYAGFEISKACIRERGLDQKAATYQRKVTEALWRLGASYKVDLRLINNPEDAGYDASAVGDVFTEVVRDEEMRNQSFIINVTAEFLDKQQEILFEASSLHEICHVMNDDLPGYRRNAANTEVAEEHCVLQTVGEQRYKEYLQAYAAYRHWDAPTFDRFLHRVKEVAPVAAPSEKDEADRLALEYFKSHADGKEHLLVYNGDLRDVTLYSARDRVLHDPEKVKAVINAGKPLIFFHNHPAEDGRAAMFPSYDDFGVAGLFLFMSYSENPSLAVEFRVMQLGKETSVVSYGFKGTTIEEIKKIALEYRKAAAQHADLTPIELRQTLFDYRLAQDSFNDYLQYACPADLGRKDLEVCTTHPQFFLWPNDKFFIHYRPQ